MATLRMQTQDRSYIQCRRYFSSIFRMSRLDM